MMCSERSHCASDSLCAFFDDKRHIAWRRPDYGGGFGHYVGVRQPADAARSLPWLLEAKQQLVDMGRRHTDSGSGSGVICGATAVLLRLNAEIEVLWVEEHGEDGSRLTPGGGAAPPAAVGAAGPSSDRGE